MMKGRETNITSRTAKAAEDPETADFSTEPIINRGFWSDGRYETTVQRCHFFSAPSVIRACPQMTCARWGGTTACHFQPTPVQ